MKAVFFNLCIVIVSGAGCHKNDNNNNNNTPVPAVYQKIYGATDKYVDGNYIVIKSNGRPDHKSPYYQGTQWSASLYEAYNGTNASFAINPNRIATSNLTFRYSN
jgi:hypothetical protein